MLFSRPLAQSTRRPVRNRRTWASLRNVSLRKYEQKNIRRGNSRYYFKSSNRVLFLFIIFNGYSSERLAIIVQVISWIIEVDFQGGRCTVNFVMFVFNVFDYSINSPTFVNNYSQFSISGICTAKGYAVSNMVVRQSEIIVENGQ